MLVKNIIKNAAEYLELKNVVKYLNNEVEIDDDISNEINSLLIATNIVNNNIASSYIELLGVKQVSSNNGQILYKDITENAIIEIKSIETLNSNKVNFKILPEVIKVDYNGICLIEYSYFPQKVLLESEINYYLKLNDITFAIGVVGEYLYLKGNIDDGYAWSKRFKNSIFNLLRPKRNIVLPARRW